MENDFENLLQGSAKAHGHLCAGQVIGVKMALLGLKLVELQNPKNSPEIKKLIVYVEIDRCATDAIGYVTGVKLGRRSLKFKDYGIMAATFVNTEINRAFRIVSKEHSRDRVRDYAPEIADPRQAQLMAYKRMPLDELFEIQEVRMDIPVTDFPGPTKVKATCTNCGIVIRDGRECNGPNGIHCHYCAGEAYYKDPLKVDITSLDI